MRVLGNQLADRALAGVRQRASELLAASDSEPRSTEQAKQLSVWNKSAYIKRLYCAFLSLSWNSADFLELALSPSESSTFSSKK